ncbi:MAG: hypothetical protein HRU16_05590 [Planctomycetes bacterium]|nr:hypothetical protein [Planctomycetota bacterium]
MVGSHPEVHRWFRVVATVMLDISSIDSQDPGHGRPGKWGGVIDGEKA